ncbi:probable disease resistance protein At1g61300 isoform X2 [Dioscorea cayenensis subsp. rotundata]|uniref:Probable disease resistance protein At1g61300 isoform X2 n=1 Tax=Dioscorea cayennensis subsp. rotundata TaxID=55577 RepID=A0AB40AUW5_DIOCR|nr:probable disease resistance protein At1g61300 isoform X2 [Dioscorea cayenensis subsp. rotundata]
MDLVKLCLSPLCSCMQSPVVRQDMSYVFSTKEKLDDVKNAMEALMAKKKDIKRDLDSPQNKGKLPNNQLQLWLDKVGEKDDKVEQLLDEYRKGNCGAGSCSLNCFSRYKISSDAIKLEKEINQLKAEQLEISLVEIPPPKLVPTSHRIFGKGISSKLDTVYTCLADETVGMVGIWGMGGVGKTTLLRKIYQSLLDDANMRFDHVLFIEASQNIQLERLREEIAKKLKLASSAGEDIFNALKLKNFVLLLDNIWEQVDLPGLGILDPYGGNSSTKQYKHKVIFTTRSEDVCAQMGAKKRIKMECLKPNEAWDLFKDNVNLDVIESDKMINGIAKEVVKKCGGLPLALQVIGKAMSNKKTVQEWEFILSSLNNSSTGVVQGVEESLLPILKFSYDSLPINMNIKECFLSASMLGWTSKDYLVECWMGLGLITDFVNLQQAYGKAGHIFNILEESCLLCFYEDSVVHLHDVINEMAMWIALDCGMNKNKWIMKRYDGLAEIPTNDAENWRYANRVIIGGMELLPTLSHQCSNLLCLMIVNSSYLRNIPEGFFQQMPNLIYLDLSGTAIKELPKDIKYLINLQYLNISSTRISSLSKELVYLNKLQYLICRNLTGLGKVEDGLISRLQKLKILDLYPYGWVELKDLNILKKHLKAIGMRVVSQEVLQQLSCLPTTKLFIENLDSLISLSFETLSCKNHGFLQELEITSCPQLEELVMNGSETRLNNLIVYDVKKLQNIIWTDLSPPKIFHMLTSLYICECNLVSFAWVLHLPCLFYLNIEDCPETETLFYIEEREIQQVLERPNTFPALHSLFLFNLPKLMSMSNAALDFPQLSWFSIHECLHLKKLPFKHGINNSERINIYCEGGWWESLEWDDATIPPHLSPSHYWVGRE